MRVINFIMKTFDVSEDIAREVMDLMSIGGFRFSSSSYEEIEKRAAEILAAFLLDGYAESGALDKTLHNSSKKVLTFSQKDLY